MTGNGRCWLMGWGGLLIACAELAAGHDFPVTGLITRYPPAVDWAVRHGIAVAATMDAVATAGPPPDYLFSVTNDVVLTEADLAVPRRMAINLHSSPLPRYAGVHQTTWALLHGESQHGVTWHEMTAKIDGGRILRQATFPIRPDDTTLTLDIQCYDHGLAQFAALLDDLASGSVSPVEQDRSERSYFPASRLFPSAGLVSWRQPAEELDRWCRAGGFGRFDNRFGKPRVLTEDTVLLMDRLRLTGEKSTVDAGTVLSVGVDSARIATTTEDIEIQAVTAPDGSHHAVGDLCDALSIEQGQQLPVLQPAVRERLADMTNACAAQEVFWLDELEKAGSAAEPVRPLWRPRAGSVSRTTVMLDRQAVRTVLDHGPEPGAAAYLLAAWLVVLDKDHGTVRFSDDHRRDGVAGLERIITRDVPFGVTLSGAAVLAAAAAGISQWLSRQATKPGYPRDLPARYPAHLTGRLHMPVVLAVSDRGERPEPGPDTAVVVGIEPATATCHIAATDHLGASIDVARQFAVLGTAVNRVLRVAARNPLTSIAELRAVRTTGLAAVDTRS